ncbi:prophage protein [Streptococcus pneumoniae]|uniref:phage tail protein n=1 Tax=Streptococcus pneumoniae TaxID=1313 RepID=UPI000A266D30|nr:phage tail protein [Streptococcus pneumoniae]VJF16121.1 prophage protein [Streptococcus pneumoniae]VNK21013.1 prophage protein [Streptococcus pneumoniae]VOH67118.1 prophage protein [Streptococcus pneumoniae]VOO02484.1 prophage protein [Streptococcus pneumoniae]VPT22752.1 prophage protein [Streptococcus pneumoniae]
MVRGYAVNFNGRNSFDDMRLILSGIEIGIPDKKKVVVTIPFSNESYDFSSVYGGQLYEQRTIKCKFEVQSSVKTPRLSLMTLRTQVVNWLFGTTGLTRFEYEGLPGYYFLAEVQQGANFETIWRNGVLEIPFTAYPFMISEKAEGIDIWDDFNFELDAFQNVAFEVNGSLDILLVNTGISLARPEITSTSNMTLTMRNQQFSIVPGSRVYDFFTLEKENKIHVEGNGRISFKWFKELI